MQSVDYKSGIDGNAFNSPLWFVFVLQVLGMYYQGNKYVKIILPIVVDYPILKNDKGFQFQGFLWNYDQEILEETKLQFIENYYPEDFTLVRIQEIFDIKYYEQIFVPLKIIRKGKLPIFLILYKKFENIILMGYIPASIKGTLFPLIKVLEKKYTANVRIYDWEKMPKSPDLDPYRKFPQAAVFINCIMKSTNLPTGMVAEFINDFLYCMKHRGPDRKIICLFTKMRGPMGKLREKQLEILQPSIQGLGKYASKLPTELADDQGIIAEFLEPEDMGNLKNAAMGNVPESPDVEYIERKDLTSGIRQEPFFKLGAEFQSPWWFIFVFLWLSTNNNVIMPISITYPIHMQYQGLLWDNNHRKLTEFFRSGHDDFYEKLGYSDTVYVPLIVKNGKNRYYHVAMVDFVANDEKSTSVTKIQIAGKIPGELSRILREKYHAHIVIVEDLESVDKQMRAGGVHWKNVPFVPEHINPIVNFVKKHTEVSWADCAKYITGFSRCLVREQYERFMCMCNVLGAREEIKSQMEIAYLLQRKIGPQSIPKNIYEHFPKKSRSLQIRAIFPITSEKFEVQKKWRPRKQ